MAGRFIKLYDKILKWEWYSDINTFRLFVHLLLRANYKDLKFEGRKILRGQFVTSLTSLSSETGLSIRQVRVSLNKLIMTGEVTNESCSKYRVITINRYDDYQSSDKADDKQMTGGMTNKWQTNDKQMTNKWQTNDKQMTTSIEQVEQVEQIEKIEPPKGGRGASRFTPPSREDVQDFCLENGIDIDVERFVDFYTSKGWMVGKNPMKDWKAAVRGWASRERKQSADRPAAKPAAKPLPVQDFEQRDYSSEQEDWTNRLLDWEKGGSI